MSTTKIAKERKGTHSQARVVRSTTSDEYHATTPPDNVQVSLETSESDSVSVKVDTTSHRVDDGFGLFVNLLLHEVVELSLHDGSEFDFESFDSTDR